MPSPLGVKVFGIVSEVPVGYTFIVNVTGVPLQPSYPANDTGVAVIVAITGLSPLFIAVNEGILPVPPAASPIPGALLTQVTVSAVPVKFIAAVAAPVITVWFDTAFITGNACTIPVTAMFWLIAPEVSTTLPDIGLGASEAADRT
jgi:hypothetical protein